MQAELNSTLMNLTIVDVAGEKANKFHFFNLFISSVWLVWESNIETALVLVGGLSIPVSTKQNVSVYLCQNILGQGWFYNDLG